MHIIYYYSIYAQPPKFNSCIILWLSISDTRRYVCVRHTSFVCSTRDRSITRSLQRDYSSFDEILHLTAARFFLFCFFCITTWHFIEKCTRVNTRLLAAGVDIITFRPATAACLGIPSRLWVGDHLRITERVHNPSPSGNGRSPKPRVVVLPHRPLSTICRKCKKYIDTLLSLKICPAL